MSIWRKFKNSNEENKKNCMKNSFMFTGRRLNILSISVYLQLAPKNQYNSIKSSHISVRDTDKQFGRVKDSEWNTGGYEQNLYDNIAESGGSCL